MPAQGSIRHLSTAGKAVRIGLTVLMLAALSRSGTSPGIFTHEAYIWQRDWTPALVEAARTSSDVVDGWRVLAAETDGHGGLFQVAVDWQVLRAGGRPVTLVLRINGQLDVQNRTALLDRFATVVGRWRDNLPDLRGVEIDYDCGTAHLAGYAQFLTELHSRIGIGTPLSVTALPTWLPSPALGRLLDATDRVVLQVHAVRDPRAGLIDTNAALRWVETLALRDPKPFQVALPAYGLRVNWRDDGTLSTVEGETPRLVEGGNSTELVAAPDDLADLVAELRRRPLGNLVGVAWFRLPTADDSRAWSLATWQSVIAGHRPTGDMAVVTQDSGQSGMRALRLVNRGDADATLPASIRLPKGCAAADGVNGYALEYRPAGLFLGRLQAGLLKAGQIREIGWMRCAETAGDVHVEP